MLKRAFMCEVFTRFSAVENLIKSVSMIGLNDKPMMNYNKAMGDALIEIGETLSAYIVDKFHVCVKNDALFTCTLECSNSKETVMLTVEFIDGELHLSFDGITMHDITCYVWTLLREFYVSSFVNYANHIQLLRTIYTYIEVPVDELVHVIEADDVMINDYFTCYYIMDDVANMRQLSFSADFTPVEFNVEDHIIFYNNLIKSIKDFQDKAQ